VKTHPMKKNANRSGMRSLTRLLPYAKPYRWHFLVVFLLVLVYNASAVAQPYLVKVAIDSDLSPTHPNRTGLVHISLLYMAVVVIGVAANYAQIVLLQFSGQNVIRRIRVELFRHIERQAMAFFDTNAIGRLVTNVSSDTETVSQFFTQFFLSVVRDGLSIVLIIIAMFELDVRIAWYSMLILPVIFGISIAFRSRLRSAYQATRTRLSNIVAFLAENLAGMRIIQIFHQEHRQASHYERLNDAHRQANVREYGTSVLLNRVLELAGNIAVAAVVWFGGGAVLKHAILFGTLYAFIRYMQQFFQPINAITQQWNTLQSAMVAAERIGRVLTIDPAIQDKPSALPHDDRRSIRGDIVFQNVSFSYVPNHPVLQDISFQVKAGSFVGVVGATGAGKSSIMSLLTRFYEPDAGVIRLDGKDIQDYQQVDLHRMIGLVQQDVQLFTGTVIDNIRLFRADISEEDVQAAATAVGAHAVIARLPNGYHTQLFGKGANLSMGERQLISFARIVCLNPRVLILDEATASLDSQTEILVQEGLAAIARSRTTLVIAHRLSTIRRADVILVLDKGGIVEQGTHDALVVQGGLYAELHAKSGVESPSVRV